jgi:hypothetical protein
MSTSVDKTSSSQSLLSGQNVVYGGIAWAVLALLFFLWFSIPVPGEDRPLWYRVGTYIFEEVALLGASLLCLRNWRSPQIASGRNVWLGIGLGLMCYFLGNLPLAWWELYWNQDPAVSPGDMFFVAFYLFLGWGMVLAVLPRRLNLETWQWGVVAISAIAAIAFAVWLSLSAPGDLEKDVATPLPQQVSATASSKNSATAQKAPAIKPTSPTSDKPETASQSQVPEWVTSLEKILEPLSKPLNLFYIVCDVFLLIIAATLLLAFWGGRFAQSWRMIAAAAFSFYIADMWFKYATDHIPNYQSGFLLEVFWVFSGVLFAVGAGLEYENSSRSRRGGRKRA